MKNEKGMLTRPSARPSERPRMKLSERTKKEEKRPVFLVGLLAVLLIVTYMFTYKTYEPVKNVVISGGILIYPLTFLVIAYISKYYSTKEAKKSTFISAGLFAIFVLLVVIGIMPEPNTETTSYNAVIQYLFANDYFMIGETRVFYPLLGQFLGLVLAFIVSHWIYSVIYKAIKNYVPEFLSMGLSVFIACIIDRIIFIPLLFAENLIDKTNTFQYFLKCLTSEFMVAIPAVFILIILYVIINKIKDTREKKKHQTI